MITVTVLILVSVWCELSVIKHNCWWISIFMKRETLWKLSGFPLRTHFLFHGWCYELVLYQTRSCTKPVQWWSARCAAAAVWLPCVAWHSYVFTVLVKSRWLAQRPRTDCGCLNILLPVRAIYNVPVHGPLSAVSNLHLREHFGSGVDGRSEGRPGRRASENRAMKCFLVLLLGRKASKIHGKVQVWSHLSQEEWWRIGYTHAQNVHVFLRMTRVCACLLPVTACLF